MAEMRREEMEEPRTPRTDRDRVTRAYDHYAGSDRIRRKWSPGPGQNFLLDQKWRVIETVLHRAGFKGDDARILNVGAGEGSEMHRFVAIGCRPRSVVCLDLLSDRMIEGRKRDGSIPFVVGDGSSLPFRDEQFDLTYQSVMASSVHALEVRRRIALEMIRVTRRGGLIVWYDTRYPNPWNAETRPITRRQLRAWFQGCEGKIRSLTLIPPVARLLAPVSVGLCKVLEAIPLFRSHLLAVLRRI